MDVRVTETWAEELDAIAWCSAVGNMLIERIDDSLLAADIPTSVFGLPSYVDAFEDKFGTGIVGPSIGVG